MTVREALQTIADDMKLDAKSFDGREFNGRTVAECFGNQAAAIAAMADIMAALLPPDPDVVTCNRCRQQVRLTVEGTLPLHPINPLLRPSPWCKSRTDFIRATVSAMPGSPAVAADLYVREDVEDDTELPPDIEGHALHGAITDREVQP